MPIKTFSLIISVIVLSDVALASFAFDRHLISKFIENCLNRSDNAEFVNGLPVCEWAPLVGFNCTADPISNPDGLCQPCQNKPAQADFVDSDDQLRREKCDFRCKQNYYGHPKWSGVCVNCGVLQATYEKVALPSNALWVSNPQECNAEAWVCLSGFTRSNSSRYCCPDVIENSHPDPSYQPCGRA